LQQFRGGVITISHNEAFVAELCTEKWWVGGGVVRMENIGARAAKDAAKLARKSSTGAIAEMEEDQ
jgi:elongation factor 3